MTKGRTQPQGFGAQSPQYRRALQIMNSDPPNIEKAFDLLRAADGAGDARATYALGTWFLHGKPPVVEKDVREALRLLEVAAAAGNIDALYDLGVLLERGDSGKINLKRAFQNYLRAAIRGEKQSVYEVGRCYHYGIGTVANQGTADIWFDRATELGIRN